MLISFFSWWYGPGWMSAFRDIQKRTAGVSRSFSLAILIRTLFAPWRRIQTAPGKGIDAQFKAFVDNMVSRAVGFTVRVIVIFVALLLSGTTAVYCTIIALVWPFLPPGIIYCLVRGITG